MLLVARGITKARRRGRSASTLVRAGWRALPYLAVRFGRQVLCKVLCKCCANQLRKGNGAAAVRVRVRSGARRRSCTRSRVGARSHCHCQGANRPAAISAYAPLYSHLRLGSDASLRAPISPLERAKEVVDQQRARCGVLHISSVGKVTEFQTSNTSREARLMGQRRICGNTRPRSDASHRVPTKPLWQAAERCIAYHW